MKRVVITGGFGFLARHLIEDLQARSPAVDIAAIDVQPAPRETVDGVRYLGGVDINDFRAVRDAFVGADAVLHLAGLVSFWSGDKDRLFRVNQLGTRNVAHACAASGVKRLVHVSSVAAIGFTDREDQFADEELAFDWSRVQEKHYMLSKRAAELELAIASAAGVSVAIANPGLMYGPGDRTNVALYRAVAAGRMPFVPPGGTNVIDVRDVAAGLCLLLFSGVRDERIILGGQNLRFTEIVRTLTTVLRAPPSSSVRMPHKVHAPLRFAADLLERCWPRRPSLTSDHVDSSFRFRYFTSRKAARILGWRPRIRFPKTVADSAAEMVRHGLLQRAGGA